MKTKEELKGKRMKVKELGDCVRPIIFENEEEEFDKYPYTVGGTCFLLEYGRKMFAVTAKHVLKNLNYKPKEVRVPPYVEDMTHFLPIFKSYANDIYETDGKDYADIILLEIARDKLHSGWKSRLKPYDYAMNSIAPLDFRGSSKLLIKGYPKQILEQNYADHDEKHMQFQALTITGNYLEESKDSEGCHLFKFDDLTDIVPSSDGMSGSPLFHVFQKNKESVARLAGMYIRGDDEKNTGLFISEKIIKQMLDKAN